VDKKGRYDFSPIDPMIAAMQKHEVRPIWELCHYGYPDDLEPFTKTQVFIDRFAAYARAAAQYVTSRLPGPYYFSPINEITFFAYIGGEWDWVAPYRRTRDDRFRLRTILCQAAIAGVKAIREVVPQARMVHFDPLVNVVAPPHQPHFHKTAYDETHTDTFLAWDILYGKEMPELGGSPEILDIVGPNNYSFGQMEYRVKGPHSALDPDHERILPLYDLLKLAWERYRRPMIIGETSGLGLGRTDWLRDVTEETLAAIAAGMDLHGVCLFPAVSMPDWHEKRWLNNGLCDVIDINGELERIIFAPYVNELLRWQKEIGQVTMLDEDPFREPLDLQKVKAAAKRLNPKPDANWH
jgi:beta-glucosidase/6-phospho-beta-glucosidase/beta-galactosidase